jgi:vacuolar-type H+-ATPase subunit I/STV1
VQSSLGFPELVAPHAATGWTCSKQEKLKLTVTLGLATICYNFAVSFPQALFFWHVKNITKEHIFHPEFLFFYLYLQVCGFQVGKRTAELLSVTVNIGDESLASEYETNRDTSKIISTSSSSSFAERDT